MPVLKENGGAERPTLYQGTGTPYVALFDDSLQPIINPITGINLGAYLEGFSYTFQEGGEQTWSQDSPGNEAKLVIKTGDPDSIDIPALQENVQLFIQYGYVFSDGSFLSSPVISVAIRRIDAVFDEQGTTLNILTKDKTAALRYLPPFTPKSDTDNFLDWLRSGCNSQIGILIKKFKST